MNTFKSATRMFFLMTVLTGLIYPLFMTLIAQSIMPYLANGSLIRKGDQVVGSALIAQKTTKTIYFWPRPSAIDYDPLRPSGGSNLGPTSQKLKEIVAERRKKNGQDTPADLLYASGSGLDPHISIEAAYFQAKRIADARSMSEENLKALIDTQIKGRQWGFLGPRYVNVLLLNQALDEKK